MLQPDALHCFSRAFLPAGIMPDSGREERAMRADTVLLRGSFGCELAQTEGITGQDYCSELCETMPTQGESLMNKIYLGLTAAVSIAALTAISSPALADGKTMSFFITSVGLGKGADLGGLKGADAHCQKLAKAAGSTKTWHAYLSTQGKGAVNARDRIGKGPWQNFKGETIAKNVADLHSDNNKINNDTGLSEKGDVINVSGGPNRHDILTGSKPDGTAFPPDKDMTCKNWTSSTDGAAMMGHHNRAGIPDGPTAKSWNSSHPSRGPQGSTGAGCSQSDLKGTGGDGLLYCFAVK